MKILTPIKAMRAKCMDCTCYQPKEGVLELGTQGTWYGGSVMPSFWVPSLKSRLGGFQGAVPPD